MTEAAKLIERQTRTYWHCPNCSRCIGELVGNRLVILIRRDWHLTFRLADGMEQTCPKCGTVSTLSSCATIPAINPSAAR